jgi:ribosome maturation factor RimP
MEKSPLIKKIERAIAPTVESMGFELVRILQVGSGKPTLQIMAERPDGTMLVDDCENLSKAISALLDVENVIDGAYYLEISSPGIDRPLTRLKDFTNFANYEIRVECEQAIEKQKKFEGRLKGTDGNNVILETSDKGVLNIPFDNIYKAKILLTDELLKAALKKQSTAT